MAVVRSAEAGLEAGEPGSGGIGVCGSRGAPERVLAIGAVRISITPGRVITTLPSGHVIHGEPHDTDAYRQTALDHGYTDGEALNRGHEVAHSLLAHWLGFECSPVFARLADGVVEPNETTRLEETAVLAIERLANHMGVDLVGIAFEQGHKP